MPKIFFCDLGIRNFFFGDFSSPATRRDLGGLSGNAAYKNSPDMASIELFEL